MIFNLGETLESKRIRKEKWHKWYAWRPVYVGQKNGQHILAWNEIVERTGHYSSSNVFRWIYRYRQIESDNMITMPIQIDGKTETTLTVDRRDIKNIERLTLDKIYHALKGREVQNIVVVPERIINVVTQ